jgi:hypothetical protein
MTRLFFVFLKAVQLLTTLLQCNPFSASMSVEELRAQWEKEAEILKQLEPKENDEEDDSRDQNAKEEEWLKIEEEVRIYRRTYYVRYDICSLFN